MAANYTAKHLQQVDALVLLAAYPTKSLTEAQFPVLSLYGSEDGVLKREKLEKARSLMPAKYEEHCIAGGNHAWFGSYGEQKGDGKAQITPGEQWEETVEAILEMRNGQGGDEADTE